MEKVAHEIARTKKSKLVGFTFNLQLSKTSRDAILGISSRINQLGGKITFDISAQTIIVLEEIHRDQPEKMLKRYTGFTKTIIKNEILVEEEELISNLTRNNEIYFEVTAKNYEEIFWKLKEDGLKIIKLADLEKLMTRFERNSIDHHYSLGLPKYADLKGTISIVTPSHTKKKEMLHYHVFPKIQGEEKFFYDFPKYYKNTPESFACFMTREEKRQINNHLQKIGGTNNLKKKSSNDLDLTEPPIPHKSNKFCNLCSIHFDNYLQHIKTEIHQKYRSNCEIFYDNLRKTFKSIRSFWGVKVEDDEIFNKNKIIQENELNNLKRENRFISINNSPDNKPQKFSKICLIKEESLDVLQDIKKSTEEDLTTLTSPASIKQNNELVLENKFIDKPSHNNIKQEINIIPLTLNNHLNETENKKEKVNSYDVKVDVVDLTLTNNLPLKTDRYNRLPMIDTEEIKNHSFNTNNSTIKTPIKISSPDSRNNFNSLSVERTNNISSEKKKIIFKVTESSNDYVNIKRHRDEFNESSNNISSIGGKIKFPFHVINDPNISRSVENKKSERDFPSKEKNINKRKPNKKDICPSYSSQIKRKSYSDKKKKKNSNIIQVDKSNLSSYSEVRSDCSSIEKIIEDDDPNYVIPKNLTRSTMKKTIYKDSSMRNFYNLVTSQDKSLKLSTKYKKKK